MSNYSYTGNIYSDKNDFLDDNSAQDINDLQDEVEAVEQVLSGGVEGQALVANASGKAVWGEGGGGGGGYCCWLIEITRDLSGEEGNQNLALDILDQIDLTIPDNGGSWYSKFVFSLIENDESGNGIDYSNEFYIYGSEGEISSSGVDGNTFYSMPEIGAEVRVCLMYAYVYEVFAP